MRFMKTPRSKSRSGTCLLCLFMTAMLASAPAVYGDAGDAALSLLQDNTDGTVGIYLKQVNGPVLEQFNQSFIFEPASTIKVLHHYHAMLQVEAGNIALTDLIDTFTAPADPPDCAADCPDPCPVDVDPFQIQLQTALQQMMEQSHNTRTQAVRVWFGEANINSTAQSIGMVDSLIQHRMGCAEAADMHNQLTLVDVGLLYEDVAANNPLPNNRQNFYDLMSQSRFFDAIIDQEAANLGLTMDEINEFKSDVDSAWKGGSYNLSDGLYRTLAGWVRLPFDCEGTTREYVHGNFVDSASDLDTQGTGDDISVFAVSSELLRDVIIDALTSKLCARPPLISQSPMDQTVECDGAGNTADLNDWLDDDANASASDECGSVSWSNDFAALSNGCGATGSAAVTFTAMSDDGCDTDSSEEMATFTIEDTEAPDIDTCPAETTVECDGEGNVEELNAWLTSFASSDVCGDVMQSNDFGGLSDDCGATGSADVQFTTTDECDNDESCNSSFTVEDTIAPDVSCSVEEDSLWPPNHMMVDVGLSVESSDICDDNLQVTVEVFSDEDDEEPTGSGSHSPDAMDIEPDTLRLRAERKGKGDGRVYLIVVTSLDECGNSNHTCCTVTVAKDQSLASQIAVAVQAADAEVECQLTGAPPAGFVVVGDGAAIGPNAAPVTAPPAAVQAEVRLLQRVFDSAP